MLEIIRRHPELKWFVFTRRKEVLTWEYESNKWDMYGQFTMLSLDKGYEGMRPPPNTYGVIVDESYHIKNNQSVRYRRLHYWTRSASSVIIANGTPIVKELWDLWAQVRLVIQGDHPNAMLMRQLYYHADAQGFGFYEQTGALKRYMERDDVKRHAIFFNPPSDKVSKHVQVNIKLTPEQVRMYRKLKEKLRLEVGNYRIEYQHKLAQAIKLHQITGGTITLAVKDTMVVGRINARKLFWLKSNLPRLRKNGVVIWCAYREEVQRIHDEFAIPMLMGGVNQVKPDSDAVVATTDMGTGTNIFGQFNTAVYYSLTYKYFMFDQSRKRIDRKDSNHENLFYYYLICPDTIDEFVFKVLMERKQLATNVFSVAMINAYMHSELSPESQI